MCLNANLLASPSQWNSGRLLLELSHSRFSSRPSAHPRRREILLRQIAGLETFDDLGLFVDADEEVVHDAGMLNAIAARVVVLILLAEMWLDFLRHELRSAPLVSP